jgi:tRNA acetyltransferase TAN1
MNPVLTNNTGVSQTKKRARPEDGDNTEQSPSKIPRIEPATNTAPVFNNDRRAFKRFKKHAKLFARNDRTGKGFLASCKQGREPQTVSELLPLLHKAITIIDPNAIATHAAATTSTDPVEQKKKFFEVYETKTAGLVAIRFVHDTISATQLLDTMLTLVDVSPKKNSTNNNNNEDTSTKTEEKSAENNTNTSSSDKYQFKFCCRITPVELFCPAQLEAILERLQPLITNVFTPKTPVKYAIVFNARNNNTLDKSVCIDKVGDLIGNTFHKVDLSNPEYVVLLEIFKDACGVSVVKNYYASNRFSVNNKTAHLAAPKPPQNNKKNKGKKGNGKKKATGGQGAKRGNKSATDGEKKTRRRSASTASKSGNEKGGK